MAAPPHKPPRRIHRVLDALSAPPAGFPPAVARPLRFGLPGPFMFIGGFGGAVLISSLNIQGLAPIQWCLGAVALVGGAMTRHYVTAMPRLIARLRAAGWLLCPHCLYDLRALDDEGVCPECGHAYTKDGVAACWIDAGRVWDSHGDNG